MLAFSNNFDIFFLSNRRSSSRVSHFVTVKYNIKLDRQFKAVFELLNFYLATQTYLY